MGSAISSQPTPTVRSMAELVLVEVNSFPQGQLQDELQELMMRGAWIRAKKLYFKPITQVIILGFVCFMCPGLYNALNGLGGGGRVDTATNDNANATHYATFAFFAFFAGYGL